ncbi:MAG: hypothetical protein E6G01_07605 [Actinobacteria bacterium]|nr:MAG: hypothetical protein E6G01_07605 [Actinomycetota bacterium]
MADVDDRESGSDHPELRTALPPALEDWRRRSATGAILTGIAFGLRQALELPREDPAIVVEAPGEPPGPPQPMELHMDPDRPEEAWVIVRPWLLDK